MTQKELIQKQLNDASLYALIGFIVMVISIIVGFVLMNIWLLPVSISGAIMILYERYRIEKISCLKCNKPFRGSLFHGKRTSGFYFKLSSTFKYCPSCGVSLEQEEC